MNQAEGPANITPDSTDDDRDTEQVRSKWYQLLLD